MVTTLIVLAHLAGLGTSLHAVFYARSSQGSIAWAMALIWVPYVALPLYWVFGRSRFVGYVRARRAEDVMHSETAQRVRDAAEQFVARLSEDAGQFRSLEGLARMPFTRGNHAELLIDGAETFRAILDGIEKAERYVLVQFYILRDDGLGSDLKDRLVERSKAGVKVYFLYDEIGSHALPRSYLDECRAAGIDIRPFHTTKGKANRFQVNFRNHRKIVVVDGRVGFVGGHNVGDEYLGKDPEFGPWRDTHMVVEGPMVQGLQLLFVEDWHWAAKSVPPSLEWMPALSEKGDMAGLVLGSGPADQLETCNLMFIHAIHSARRRVWIASPYFVPNEEIVAALQLAGLRGVDVRILLPKNPDDKLVWLASFSYLEIAAKTNLRIHRYTEGFMHQKVILVDDVAGVGTANLDNRSLRLNFEVTALLADAGFAAQVEKMFLADFERSTPATADELVGKSFPFKLAVKVARLFSPIL